MKLILQLVFSLSATSFAIAHAENFRELSVCDAYLNQVERTLTDPDLSWDHPSKFLQLSFPENAYPVELQKFEDDIVRMFTETAPAARNWKLFGERWNLNEDEVLDVRSFYGLNFFDFPGIVGDRQVLIAHVRAKSLRAFVAAGEHPAARNYSYYTDNVGKLSVPEMAQALNISEGQVYRELALLNISLADYFTQNEAALGDDTQAGRFARHAQNLENRGVTWDRIFSFRGTQRTEIEIFRELFDEEKSYQEIATALNKLAGDLSPDDMNIRTEQSVAAKIQSLGLAPMNRLTEANIAITPYGVVKQSGNLVPMPAIEFIWDHRQMPIAWLADKLGVQVQSLQKFLKTQHLDGLIELGSESALQNLSGRENLPNKKNPTPRSTRSNLIISSPEEAQFIASTIAENDAAILNLHQAIALQKKIPATTRDKGTGKIPLSSALGINYERFCGTANYADGNPLAKFRLNQSRLQAMERSLARVHSNPNLNANQKITVTETLQDEIAKLKFIALSPSEQNEIVIRNFQKAIAEQGSIPSTAPDKITGEIPLNRALGVVKYDKFYSFSNYAHGNLATALNDSKLQALERSLERVDSNSELDAEQKATVAKVLSREIKNIHNEALSFSEQNKKAIYKLHRAIVEQKQIPPVKATSQQPHMFFDETVGIDYTKFTGTGHYADGARKASSRLNDSRLQAMERTLEHVEANADLNSEEKIFVSKVLQAEINNLKFENLPLSEQNKIAAKRLVHALLHDGKIPSTTPDKVTGKIPLNVALGINYVKFTGTANHAPGGVQYDFRLNDSRLDAMQHTLNQANASSELDASQKARVREILEKEIAKLKLKP